MGTPNSETSTIYKYLGNENPDGILIGKATGSLIGFFGNTPAIQRASAAATSQFKVAPNEYDNATTGVTATSPWGFAYASTPKAIVNLLNEIVDTLRAYGLWQNPNNQY